MVAKQGVIKTKRGSSPWEHECARCILWQFWQFSNLMTKTREVVVQIFSHGPHCHNVFCLKDAAKEKVRRPFKSNALSSGEHEHRQQISCPVRLYNIVCCFCPDGGVNGNIQ